MREHAFQLTSEVTKSNLSYLTIIIMFPTRKICTHNIKQYVNKNPQIDYFLLGTKENLKGWCLLEEEQFSDDEILVQTFKSRYHSIWSNGQLTYVYSAPKEIFVIYKKNYWRLTYIYLFSYYFLSKYGRGHTYIIKFRASMSERGGEDIVNEFVLPSIQLVILWQNAYSNIYVWSTALIIH